MKCFSLSIHSQLSQQLARCYILHHVSPFVFKIKACDLLLFCRMAIWRRTMPSHFHWAATYCFARKMHYLNPYYWKSRKSYATKVIYSTLLGQKTELILGLHWSYWVQEYQFNVFYRSLVQHIADFIFCSNIQTIHNFSS